MNRKLRQLLLFAALVFIMGPAPVLAAQFHTGDEVRLHGEQPISENAYIAGGEVGIDTAINGDAFVAGGQVRITGPVRDDLFVAGGDVTIEGSVGGDLRVAGGNVRISSAVGGDLLVAGGEVELLEEATVTGQTNAGAGRLVIAGATQQVEAAVGELRVTAAARIQGDLVYTSENEARIAEGATIAGSVTRREMPAPRDEARRGLLFFFTSGGIIWLLSSLIIALLFVLALPAKAAALAHSWRTGFGMNVLWGLLVLIATPVAALMLMLSVVGLPLGLLLLVAYLLFMFIAKLVTVVAVGSWAISVVSKLDSPLWAAVIVGMLLLILASAVPVIGPLAVFVAFLAGLGALARYDSNLYRKLRERGDF